MGMKKVAIIIVGILFMIGCKSMNIAHHGLKKHKANHTEAVIYVSTLKKGMLEYANLMKSFVESCYRRNDYLDVKYKPREYIDRFLDTIQNNYITYQKNTHSIKSKLGSLKEIDSSINLKEHVLSMLNNLDVATDSIFQIIYLTINNNPQGINNKVIKRRVVHVYRNFAKSIKSHQNVADKFLFKYDIENREVERCMKSIK